VGERLADPKIGALEIGHARSIQRGVPRHVQWQHHAGHSTPPHGLDRELPAAPGEFSGFEIVLVGQVHVEVDDGHGRARRRRGRAHPERKEGERQEPGPVGQRSFRLRQTAARV
jgi:hypothetical protein